MQKYSKSTAKLQNISKNYRYMFVIKLRNVLWTTFGSVELMRLSTKDKTIHIHTWYRCMNLA